jgi:hypothetical protein
VDKAISFIADAKQVAPTSPSSCTSAPAPCTRRTMCPRSGPTSTRASSTTAGRPTASRCSPARRSWASSRPTELSRHDPTCPTWDSLSADERREALRRMMEVFAGFLSHTDHHIGRLIDFLKRIGEFDNTIIMVISDNGASSEGGPTARSTRPFFNNVPELAGGEPGRHRRARRPETSTTTPGAGPGPATRRSAAGSARPTAAASATRSSSTGPRASRPRARCARSTPTPSTWCPPCWTLLGHRAARRHQGRHPVAARGVSFAHTFDDAEAPSNTHPVLRDDRPPLHLPRRLAGGLPVARPVVHRGRPWVFGEPHRQDKLTELDATGWELYHVAEDFAENHNVAPRSTAPS